MLFDRLHGGGAGHSPGPSDEAKLKLPWLPKPAFAPPFLPLWPWEIQNFQNVPSLSSSRLGDVKPGTTKKKGKREPYLSYACNLFLQLPHARRYVNAPSAPTTAPARPGPGAWHSSVPGEGRHEEAEGPLALQRPGKGKATERQLHSIKCSSRAKVRRRGTASSKRGSRNAQSRVISVLTIEEAAERYKTQSVTSPKGKEKPTSSIGRCSGLGRSGQSWHRGHGARGGQAAQGKSARRTQEVAPDRAQSLPFQRSRRVVAGGKKPGQKQTPGTRTGLPESQSGEAGLGSAPGSETPVPGCEHPRRRAGPAEGVRELRHTAAARGGSGRGKEH